jgi:radical SAM protein, TIGR01212 family
MIDKRYNVYSDYLFRKYGRKVYKIPVNIPCTCPNRDGTIGIGGCIYCGEKGAGFENMPDFVPVEEQLRRNITYIKEKYKADRYIAYFQNYSNTYIPIELFKDYVSRACIKDVVEISVSTRPDCINEEYIEFLKKLSEERKVDISIELGLQTVNYHTLNRINRGHTLAEFIDAVQTIKKYGFSVCTHMILDLPWDDMDDVIEGARVLSALRVDMVKIHSLYFVKGTVLSRMYEEGSIVPVSMDDYIDRVVAFLENLNPGIVIQRLIGRVPEKDSIYANWNTSWWRIRDMIEKKMEDTDTFQGKYFNYLGGKALNRLSEGGCSMLLDKCKKYYEREYNLNCSECMLYAANEEYNLRLDKESLKLSAGFGGGMAVEDVCGAITGSIMVLGRIFVNERAHESEKIKTLTKEFIDRFSKRLKATSCGELKRLYRNEQKRCFDMIEVAAEILDDIVRRERTRQ